MDNDDFKTDTLTGASETNHRTNVMFVQNENLIDPNSLESTAPTQGQLIYMDTALLILLLKSVHKKSDAKRRRGMQMRSSINVHIV